MTAYRVNNLTNSTSEAFEHNPRAQHASIPTPFQLHVKLLRESDQRFTIICPKCEGNRSCVGFGMHVVPCTACAGEGFFEDVYTTACQLYIHEAIISSRGVAAGKLKSRLSSGTRDRHIMVRQRHNRAYYVWRMARFYGGVDMSMPMTASMNCHHDPLIYELDAMANALAQKAFGSNMHAAQRWTGVL
jgi:hypothetical protein